MDGSDTQISQRKNPGWDFLYFGTFGLSQKSEKKPLDLYFENGYINLVKHNTLYNVI